MVLRLCSQRVRMEGRRNARRRRSEEEE